MSELQTIDETLSRNLKEILRAEDLRKIARKTSYSVEFVRLLLRGDRSINHDNRVILQEAKNIARMKTLQFNRHFGS